MNKMIQKNIHKMFGRVTAFVLAFVMTLTLMPIMSGTTVMAATENYASDNASFSASKEYDTEWSVDTEETRRMKKTTVWTFTKNGSTANTTKTNCDVLGIIFNGKYGKDGFDMPDGKTSYIPVDSETENGVLTIVFSGSKASENRALLVGGADWFS